MKTKLLFFLILFCGYAVPQSFSQTTSITLKNSLSFDRTNETVEVVLDAATYESLSALALYDDANNPVVYQVLPYDNKIIFQASINKGETKVYTLKSGTPATTAPKTFAGIMMPSTRADIAWENDRTAYRMYAKKLLSSEPNSANGADLWVKKMAQPVVEKMYTYSNYHSEQKEGVDAYSVGGKTLGAGGIVAYTNNKLGLHDPYDECEIITNGPLRSEFLLTYKKVEISGDYYTKTVRITTNANGLLNKAVVKYEGKLKKIQLAAGIFLHTNTNGNSYITEKNVIAYAEKESEGTVTSPNPRFYTGIYMPGETSTTVVSNQQIIYTDYIIGTEFTYYFGGGWNIFPEGEYSQDSDWFNAVKNFKLTVENPLNSLSPEKLPSKKEIINTALKVNNYCIMSNSNISGNTWRPSVYQSGNLDLYKVYPDYKYLQYALQWAKKNNWTAPKGGNASYPSTFYIDADNHTCGQTYIDLYLMDEEKSADKIKSIKDAIDYRISVNPASDDWWWIDAMLMAMPTITRLGVALEDETYFEKMYELFSNIKNRTVVSDIHTRGYLWPKEYQDEYGVGPILAEYDNLGGLYSETDHLWWRDWGFKPGVPPKKVPGNSSKDVPKSSPNGENIYWSRGNGWVLAALARTLEFLPETAPHRSEYIQVFSDMAAKLKDIQREDGFWNMNLADDQHYPGPETSGTALFAYGMAWGINNNLLDRNIYFPVVAKAWNGLCKSAVSSNGRLTLIQNEGEDPIDPSKLSADVEFGIGVFLWTASEIVKLAPGEMPEVPESPSIIIQSAEMQTNKRVLVTFSEDIDESTALNIENYEISGEVEIYGAARRGTNQVLLALTDRPDYGKYILHVSNVESLQGKVIPENSSSTFIYPVPLSLTPPQTKITITAIGNQTGNPPSNVMDNNLGTRWAQEGRSGQWIKFDMGEPVNINAIDISFFKGNERVAYFDIDVSSDNKIFTPVLTGLESSGLTEELERYAFDPVNARYIRIVCNSNSAATSEHWNSVTEVRVIYNPLTTIDVISAENQIITYPNPLTNNYAQLILDLKSNTEQETNIIVSNVDGKILLTKKIIPQNGIIILDNPKLHAGYYLLTISNENVKVTKTIIVK
ncbi:MAG: glycoside hydrolase family 88 protein [Dysgonamonadaceae bacterium]|nr:glycoside hydrolase family 88 protein [Dysgonamonadaceae bacterium]